MLAQIALQLHLTPTLVRKKYGQNNSTCRSQQKTRRSPHRGAANNNFNTDRLLFLYRWTAAVPQGAGRNTGDRAGPGPDTSDPRSDGPDRPGADRNRPAANSSRPNSSREKRPACFGPLCEEAVRTAQHAGI